MRMAAGRWGGTGAMRAWLAHRPAAGLAGHTRVLGCHPKRFFEETIARCPRAGHQEDLLVRADPAS